MAESKKELKIRPASVDGYLACPRHQFIKDNRYMLVREHDVKIRPDSVWNVNSVVGTAAHFLVEKAHNKSPEEQLAMAMEKVDVSMSKKSYSFTKTVQTKADISKQAVRLAAEANRLTEGYLADEDMDRELELRSKPFNVGQVSVHFNGKIDIYDSTQGTLNDMKCSAGQTPSNYSGQLGAYAKILRDTGRPLNQMDVVWLPIRTLSKPQPAGKVQRYNPADCLQHAVEGVKIAVQAHAIFEETKDTNKIRANPSHWGCSETYCPAYATSACRVTQTVTQQPDPDND